MTLKEAINLLSEAGIDSPEYDARQLFLTFTGLNSTEITLHASSDAPNLIDALNRRAAREPLQYIIGSVGFYREEYEVTPDCLIPRSDTEILVDYAVKHIPRGERFADLCAGSGCIGISTLANTKDTTCLSVDISEAALALTKKNAALNHVSERLTIRCADLMATDINLGENFFAILSNPPYIPEEVYLQLEKEIFHEPRIAFVGDDDGMRFYKVITPLALAHLKDDGFIAFEIGYDQAEKIRAVAAENACTCEIIKDYSCNDRVAVLKRI